MLKALALILQCFRRQSAHFVALPEMRQQFACHRCQYVAYANDFPAVVARISCHTVNDGPPTAKCHANRRRLQVTRLCIIMRLFFLFFFSDSSG
jgi:hypothetical protein